MCSELLNSNKFSIRFMAKVIGTLVSSLPAVEYGELYYRYLEICKDKALKEARGNFDCCMSLDFESKNELTWWLCNITTSCKSITQIPITCMLTTDASLKGWGAVFRNESTGGEWNDIERTMHINVLELLAILFGLQSFLSETYNAHIRIRTDNATAVAYINNKGGVKSIRCHEIAKRIWIWAIDKGNYISAEHLPGVDNCLADKASRVFDNNTEWELDKDAFDRIVHRYGKFDIDIFAS